MASPYFPVAAGYGNLPNAAWVPTIFSQKVLKKFRKIAVAHQITNTDYSGEISDYGDSVHIISEPDVQVQTYVRGAQVTPTDLVDIDQVMTVDQGNYFAFKVDDVEKAQSHINWESLASDRAAYKLNDSFDTNVFSYLSTNFTTSTIGSTGTPAVVALSPSSGQFSPLGLLNRCARLLRLQNVPMDDLWFVADPYFWELMEDENNKLMAVNITGDAASQIRPGIFDGKVIEGKLRGFDCYLSNNLPVAGTGPSGSGSSNYGYILAGHKSSAATATQIVKTESFRDPDSFADIVRGLNVFGRKVLRPEAGVSVVYNRAGV
jgi:hypothetical protein